MRNKSNKTISQGINASQAPCDQMKLLLDMLVMLTHEDNSYDD